MNMTNEQQQFFDLLARFPRLEIYWDKEKKELNVGTFEAALNVMSSAESAIARWLAGVWLNDNRFGFDLFQHMPKLQGKELQTFQEWVNNPFYP